MKRIVSILLIIVLITLQVSAVFAEETYYVQVGAFQSKYNAEKYTNYMISIGYDAVTIKVYDLYKVFLGPYETEERAREILADYKSVGGDGFFVIASQMYYRTEIIENDTEEETEEVVEEVVEETEEDTTTEENVATEETEEAVNETETEEVDEVEEKEEESEDDVSTIEVKVIEQEEPEDDDYKLFTIILIVVLWVLFIIGLVIFRLNQNRVSTK